MPTGYVLSEAEVKLLKEMYSFFKQTKIKMPSRSKFDASFAGEEDHQAPESYIAFPQEADGIPALTQGEGTAPDVAGVATCDIYRIIVDNTSSDPEVIAIENLEKEVYNLSTSAVDQEWIIVHRDKFGNWLTSPPGSGGGARIRAEIISVDCTANPIEATCMVLSRPCGVAQVEGEDESGMVLVYDRLGCVFTEPEADLIGRQLKADYLDSGFLGTGTVAAGTGSDDQPCQWEVDFLCCGEDNC